LTAALLKLASAMGLGQCDGVPATPGFAVHNRAHTPAVLAAQVPNRAWHAVAATTGGSVVTGGRLCLQVGRQAWRSNARGADSWMAWTMWGVGTGHGCKAATKTATWQGHMGRAGESFVQTHTRAGFLAGWLACSATCFVS